jgi:hypothetical protein
MYKLIGIAPAIMPIVLFLRAIFMRSKEEIAGRIRIREAARFCGLADPVLHSLRGRLPDGACDARGSPLDPGTVAALAPHHFVSLLECALALAILALLFLLAVALLHWVLQIERASLARGPREARA